MDLSRLLPLLCEFGIGAILMLAGVWGGLRGGYLNLTRREDRRLLWTFAAGFLVLLAVYGLFTFWLPGMSVVH
ncbi:MAG TPA: hypothetical protein PK349_07835 [Candidatus Hydrogenedentes bacterium]|nr:hypothetical protein [Candidatus Hydrogenedentota bacterium]HOJ67255.1 hypothetical protein [Candidatus Hydrogenedentota bacterium]HOV60961.1 hypothetical protein [Candidatus Hydrogenedentota bacterium]